MKDIKNYEGVYAITEDGKVWSYRSKKFLKPKVKSNGYHEITLSIKNVKKSCLIHRLVAEAYIPNPEHLPQVSHIDEDCTNNSVENLKWATAKENCNMPKHKERKHASQLNNASSKAVICVETGEVYPSMSEAARQMGCTPQNIRQACLNSNKKACGFHWKKK